MTPSDAPTVFVIDDDPHVRESIQGLLKSVGLRSQSFGTTQEFLRCKRPDGPSCLVLDVRLPGVNGLEFQRELADKGLLIPIIFITGHGDIPMTVKAMKSGAVEFLTKPFRDQDLLDAIHQALDRDRVMRQRQDDVAELRKHYDALTAREREVMGLVVSGMQGRPRRYISSPRLEFLAVPPLKIVTPSRSRVLAASYQRIIARRSATLLNSRHGHSDEDQISCHCR